MCRRLVLASISLALASCAARYPAYSNRPGDTVTTGPSVVRTVDLLAEHETIGFKHWGSIDREPIAGEKHLYMAVFSEPVSERAIDVVADDGSVLESAKLDLAMEGMPAEIPSGCAVITAPAQPFRIFVRGKTRNGTRFVALAPARHGEARYFGQYLRVEVEPSFMTFHNKPHQKKLTLQNTGEADRFSIRVEDDKGWITSPRQLEISLAKGAVYETAIELMLPKVAPDQYPGDSIRVEIRSLSQPNLHTWTKTGHQAHDGIDEDNDNFDDQTSDNCVGVRNPDQRDADGDGKGDACDS